ncbi:MAG TPA: class I SAM-dependent methyltransferase [Acetobacteraceae bacterium]|nr:class I SAM-dependent methyltransferase [Acetobacteraceae bacterium]
MPGWDHGYVTDVTYTTNFYREITPVWLATACLLLGQRAPDLARPFRYADLGCGHGFTTLVVAANHPEAEVWGFDFNPAHIEWATRLAETAGLSNAHFVETSFADLAARAEASLPQFDFMVSHGVASWISPENRRLMLDVVRQRLRPGGLAYISYNVSTGWAAMVPVRRLMCMLADASPARTDQASAGALDFIDRMRQSGALFFQGNPRIESRLEDIRRQDPRYTAHEYLNRDWHPLMFADMAEEMYEARCVFIGSATLTDNVDALSAPESMLPLLSEAGDRVLRETLRDFASAESFRRDIYRRGLGPIAASEHAGLLDALAIAPLGQTVPDPISFTTPLGTVTGRTEVYRPLFEMLVTGVRSLREIRESPPFAGRPLGELLQAITLMIAGGYAHPVRPGGVTAEARDAARRLNEAVAVENTRGVELQRLAVPLTGSALQVDLLETLMLGDLLSGLPATLPNMALSVMSGLERSGRTMQRDGKPVTDLAEMRIMAAEIAERFLTRRTPLLQILGVLEPPPPAV